MKVITRRLSALTIPFTVSRTVLICQASPTLIPEQTLTMPKKGRGKKKKNGKGKGKKAASKALAATEAEELLKTSKRFIKAYQAQCAAMGTVASQQILKDLRISVENERLLPKVK